MIECNALNALNNFYSSSISILVGWLQGYPFSLGKSPAKRKETDIGGIGCSARCKSSSNSSGARSQIGVTPGWVSRLQQVLVVVVGGGGGGRAATMSAAGNVIEIPETRLKHTQFSHTKSTSTSNDTIDPARPPDGATGSHDTSSCAPCCDSGVKAGN